MYIGVKFDIKKVGKDQKNSVISQNKSQQDEPSMKNEEINHRTSDEFDKNHQSDSVQTPKPALNTFIKSPPLNTSNNLSLINNEPSNSTPSLNRTRKSDTFKRTSDDYDINQQFESV
jgi:hypothetical protein